LGIILLSPLPFFNTIPAMTVLILGIGLFNRDALFLVGGLVLSAGVIAVAIAGADTLITLVERLIQRAR
ncbi:MAG: exopolysaccharide biosynthesis protein, partial [Bacillati bacterium ANGP1]